MSRIGKAPVSVPNGVTVTLKDDNVISVKGPKGELTRSLPAAMTIAQENGQVTVTLKGSAPECQRDQATTALQAQQLAWTVVENSDLPQDVGVSFVDGSGQASERWVADSEMVVSK